MNKSLEISRNELEWLAKNYKATPIHIRNKFQETLRYEIVYNRKKTQLTITFIYMPKQDALGCDYEYNSLDKKSEVFEKHRFADVLQGIELPAIQEEDIKRLKDNIGFEKVDGIIKGTLSPTTQAITYTEVIKRNLENMLKYGRSL